MRLWSIHPKYLDRVGLVALWRESLLAQKVLQGETKGYRNHPQLDRFKKHQQPQNCIAYYLMEIWRESRKRGYKFNRQKIASDASAQKVSITKGQLKYEFNLLCERLKRRDPERYRRLLSINDIEPHPIFNIVDGDIENWERT